MLYQLAVGDKKKKKESALQTLGNEIVMLLDALWEM